MHRLFLLTILALSSFVPASYGMAQQQQFVLTEQDKAYLMLCAKTPQNAPIFDRLFEFYTSEKVLTQDLLIKAFYDAIDNCCAQQVRLLITQGEPYITHVKKTMRRVIRSKQVNYIIFFLENGFFDAKRESHCRNDLTAQEAAYINRVLFVGDSIFNNCKDEVFIEQEPGRLSHELFCTNIFPTKEQVHEIISILKMYGADINVQDHNGNTVLLYFIFRANSTSPGQRYDEYKASIITVLLDLGANPDICNNMGENSFMQILDKRDVQAYQPLVRKCIDLGANTDIIDDLSCKYGIQLLDENTKEHIQKHWLTAKSMPAANIAAQVISELTKSNAEEYAQGIIYEYLVGEQKKDKSEQEKNNPA